MKDSHPEMVKTLERLTMAHRYLYYVKAQSVLPDYDYDVLEKRALKVVGKNSPLREPGSDIKSSYSADVRGLAWSTLTWHTHNKSCPQSPTIPSSTSPRTTTSAPPKSAGCGRAVVRTTPSRTGSTSKATHSPSAATRRTSPQSRKR